MVAWKAAPLDPASIWAKAEGARARTAAATSGARIRDGMALVSQPNVRPEPYTRNGAIRGWPAFAPRSPHVTPTRSQRAARQGPVAQWLEPAAHNGLVAGSSPAGPTSLRLLRKLRLGKPALGGPAKQAKAVSTKPRRGEGGRGEGREQL